MADSSSKKAILEFKIPRDCEETPEVAAAFLANLATLVRYPLWDKLLLAPRPAVFLEMAALDQGIHFFAVLPQKDIPYFESQLSAQYPLVVTAQTKDYLNFGQEDHLAFGQIRQTGPFYYPLRTWRSFEESDPLSSVLSSLSKAGPGEKMLVQLALSAPSPYWQTRGWRAMVKETPETIRFQNQVTNKLIEQKIGQSGFLTGIRLLVSAKSQDRAQTLLASLSGAFGVFSAEANSLRFRRPLFWQKNRLLKSILSRKATCLPRNQIFNLDELSSIWHLPAGLKVLNISWARSFPSEPPENLPTAEGEKEVINFFARTEFKNKMATFGIKREDRRRHIYVIGKTGTGKSTLLANMIISDFRKKEGMAVIDPHGDLSETILDYVPSYRINDVVYLDPGDQKSSFILNPLEIKNPEQKELVVSGIIAIFHKLYTNTWGPRLEHILRNCLFALLAVEGASFLEVPQFLSDRGYRQKIVDKIPDPVIRNFWEIEFEHMPPNLQAEATGPILNKVGQFLSSPLVRNIVGRPHSTIDLEQIMNEGKILILNLSQGRLGEDSSALLGAMIITKFQLAAMNRINIPEKDRKDFFLYVDEFQNFATTSFIKILSEARKYRLNLTLANQYTAQVAEDVQAAILGNVGTLVSFLVGAEDARRFFYEFSQIYKESDFTSLANYQILLKLAIDNHTSRPFMATTLPLPDCRTQNREKVLKVSKERYTRPSA